ncbi:hypothetical protein HK407_10g16150 [Ordospora pajunii]|uniref:uncharacterized protein n=1 Tax=Ordospora pajunii TaxID=3039483 RepID=UPI00295290E0|nr:uncharacterized protein HK407_10g16150 [Ordospora pajunii]KAH9410849.1 hypothetical protein HK407_10g16150 [Ordospora pajunii]
MFAFVLFALRCLCTEHLFMQESSLLTPYVDGVGNFANWNAFGESVVKIYGKNTFVQLGFSSPDSSGAIVSSQPIKHDRFCIDFVIEIANEENNGNDGEEGMSIWMSGDNAFEEGACYGRSCSFNGILIAIKPSGKSYIGVKAGDVYANTQNADKSFDKVIYRDFVPGDAFVVRIEQDDQLIVYIGESNNLVPVHSYKAFASKKDNFIGVSAYTGKYSPSMRIISIESYKLKNFKRLIRDESQRGGSLVWILFFVVICVTGYYLYSIQIKKK